MLAGTAAPRPHVRTWLGQAEPNLDTVVVTACGRVVLGSYGGCRASGATSNEDGALVWASPDGAWEVAMLLDAHVSAESAALVLTTVAAQAQATATLLAQPVAVAIPAVQRHFVALFSAATFRAACRHVRGETACLLCVRRAQFLWWLSVGDCVAYVLHPELARLGQYALNQRQFFEWVGQVNTFDLAGPCYASGVRELRSGRTVVLLATDGLLECGQRPFGTPEALYRVLAPHRDGAPGLAAHVRTVLQRVHDEQGRDSATVIAWACERSSPAAIPTA